MSVGVGVDVGLSAGTVSGGSVGTSAAMAVTVLTGLSPGARPMTDAVAALGAAWVALVAASVAPVIAWVGPVTASATSVPASAASVAASGALAVAGLGDPSPCGGPFPDSRLRTARSPKRSSVRRRSSSAGAGGRWGARPRSMPRR
ncbi:hypothetical protein SRB17_05370 [Streptomyces sp. RB17]|uniref:hypothetical protein n=1 Tax=Streptomyces sp. RB17 TaxID=2585197 RepID=UPI00130A592D|nr:hypothetical protein [Streptomyces sp. RB17]MQY32583.1 hypothetical protein [Streptomyces sp. RB17]